VTFYSILLFAEFPPLPRFASLDYFNANLLLGSEEGRSHRLIGVVLSIFLYPFTR